ncbi:iron chaperone [Alkalibacterium putridalgicola]|uniref:iron chaperone n=1 Tax=Alkalibacterium putridalgicola TaxID=426703 RepID=UPI0034CF973D
METFDEYLKAIDDEEMKQILSDIYQHVEKVFPDLGKRIAWNQPMYTDHDTFIIAFSAARNHISVAPEKAALRQFNEEIEGSDYDLLKETFKIKRAQPVNYDLLDDMIRFNIEDKKDCTTFWRK